MHCTDLHARPTVNKRCLSESSILSDCFLAHQRTRWGSRFCNNILCLNSLYRQLQISILLFISSKELLSLSLACSLSPAPKTKTFNWGICIITLYFFCCGIQSDRTRTEEEGVWWREGLVLNAWPALAASPGQVIKVAGGLIGRLQT